ncbi:MAG: phosphopantothenate/pantothenate synthetase family protein, partial [Pyrobaculum sp.]
TEALRRLGKTVIAIDLNPLSRTAQAASVTIVDNVTRAVPKLVETVKRLKDWDRERLLGLLRSYDNGATLADAVNHIAKRLTDIAASLPRRGGVVV